VFQTVMEKQGVPLRSALMAGFSPKKDGS